MSDRLKDAPIPEDIVDDLADGEPHSNNGNGEYLPYESEKAKLSLGTRITIKELLAFEKEFDAASVLGDRYLCKGGSCVIVAATSVGKSSLGMQMAIMFALGLSFFGIRPGRPLKSVYVQAENDVGDTAEMFQGVLAGLGIVPQDPEAAAEMVKLLEDNLIIVRDQVNIGMGFSSFARALVEEHKPDLFWVDPLLSFYGDDINDQKAMSRFLRGQLNPISEATGIIWMLLHHTGKPNKEATKAQKSWNSRDFAYMGIGSSELSNWARAIICLTATSEDEFRMILAKRGWRAGLMDGSTPVTEINLAHSTDHICWKHIPKPQDVEEMADKFASFAATITTPTKASHIVRDAAKVFKRGARTVWTMWGSGEGALGKYFTSTSDGLWKCRQVSKNAPYKDD